MNNIIVTGASKGLGLTTTKKLLESGCFVYAVSRTMSGELKRLSDEYSNQLKFVSYDLSNPDDIKKHIFCDKFIDFKTPIHGFVNNAAQAYDDIATNINIDRLHSMFNVNVLTPMNITKYVIRHMLLHKIEGSLVHISSISAHTGYKGLSMYASTKGAMEAFSKNISREWGVKGIRSNCVVSGFMDTEMSSSLDDSQRNRIYNRTSLKKPTDIDSVADTICFLLSDKSRSITGQNVFVDSGTI